MRDISMPEGYEIPIHRSLTQPMLWMGIPRSLFFIAIFFGLFGAMIFKSWIAVAISACLYSLFRFLARHDKEFHRVWFARRYYKSFYYQ